MAANTAIAAVGDVFGPAVAAVTLGLYAPRFRDPRDGIEVGGHTNPLPNLKLDIAYTYLDNKVTKDDSGLLGTRPYGVPQQTASAFGIYTFQGGVLDGVGIGGGFRYIGQSYNGVVGTTCTIRSPWAATAR
jgi:outer membrane receptor for monomeric catechols